MRLSGNSRVFGFRAKFSVRAMVVATLVCLFSPAPARGEDWPAWRGPRGDSTSMETGLPTAWNDQTGVVWRAELPEWGTSTPAIWGELIFVTTQHEQDLLALAIDRRTGSIRWTQKVGQSATERGGPKREKQKFHQLHNLASPSPVTDGRTVVFHFGNGELAAYDFAGTLRWRRNLQADYGAYTIWWGHANSPVLYDGLAISACMQDSLAEVADKPTESYLVAHDLETGAQRWRSARMTGARAEEGDAYTTPLLVELQGKTELVVMGANQLDGYDPRTGKQIWYLPGLVGGRTVTGPTPGSEFIYVTRGMRGPLLAVKLDGRGELTRDAIAWKYDKGTPDTPCTVVWNDLLFAVTDDGIARAFDALTGRLHWTQRLKGDYKASPLTAEGRIYFLNTTGLCTVVSASPRYEKLAENQLPDSTLASPAAAGGQLFIRSRQALWCLGQKQPGTP